MKAGSGCMVYLKLIGSRYRMWRAAGQLGDSWQGREGEGVSLSMVLTISSFMLVCPDRIQSRPGHVLSIRDPGWPELEE